jgi:predicted nuclease of predicted toxin-antitoxin system
MKLYLDEDTVATLLVKLLRQAGHDIMLPVEIGMVGKTDPVQLTRAIREGRAFLTKNYDDFLILHELIVQAKGTHPGILTIRQKNDSTRDLTPKGIVNALRKLESSGAPVGSQYVVLNQWR